MSQRIQLISEALSQTSLTNVTANRIHQLA